MQGPRDCCLRNGVCARQTCPGAASDQARLWQTVRAGKKRQPDREHDVSQYGVVRDTHEGGHRLKPFSKSSSDHRIVTTWTHKLCVGRLLAYKHLSPRPPVDKARLAHKDWNKTNDSADARVCGHTNAYLQAGCIGGRTIHCQVCLCAGGRS